MSDLDRVDKELGKLLEEVRVGLKLTRQQVVERLGDVIKDRSLMTYERGLRAMTTRRVRDLAQAYGVSAVWLHREAELRAGRDPACPSCGRD